MADDYTIEFAFRNQRWTDATAGLTAFSEELKKDWDGSARVLSAELKKFLDSVADALVTRHSGGWPGGTTDFTLSKRTGALVDAIKQSVVVAGSTFSTIEGMIGAKVPYAKIQETGGVIQAKGKYLAIPLPAALDGRGVPLKPGPRAWANTFCAKTKAGNLVIFQKSGVTITPLYVLKDSVTIKPRLGMRKTLDAGLGYFVDQAVDRIVAAVLAA